MPKFTIVYKDNSMKDCEAASKESLIADFCQADPTAFQEDVKEIRWVENGFAYIEHVATGKIKKQEQKNRVA